eukprot:gene9852-7741_t
MIQVKTEVSGVLGPKRPRVTIHGVRAATRGIHSRVWSWALEANPEDQPRGTGAKTRRRRSPEGRYMGGSWAGRQRPKAAALPGNGWIAPVGTGMSTCSRQVPILSMEVIAAGRRAGTDDNGKKAAHSGDIQPFRACAIRQVPQAEKRQTGSLRQAYHSLAVTEYGSADLASIGPRPQEASSSPKHPTPMHSSSLLKPGLKGAKAHCPTPYGRGSAGPRPVVRHQTAASASNDLNKGEIPPDGSETPSTVGNSARLHIDQFRARARVACDYRILRRRRIVNERLSGELQPWEVRNRLEHIRLFNGNWEAIYDYVTKSEVIATLAAIEEASRKVEEALSQEQQERTSVSSLKEQLEELQAEVDSAHQRLHQTQERMEQNLQHVNRLKVEALSA